MYVPVLLAGFELAILLFSICLTCNSYTKVFRVWKLIISSTNFLIHKTIFFLVSLCNHLVSNKGKIKKMEKAFFIKWDSLDIIKIKYSLLHIKIAANATVHIFAVMSFSVVSRADGSVFLPCKSDSDCKAIECADGTAHCVNNNCRCDSKVERINADILASDCKHDKDCVKLFP